MSDSNFKVYLFEYYHEGSWWSVKIPAASMDDAQARMNKMPLAKPVGELFAEIPARLGFLAKCACVVRNFFAARQAIQG
jgi:hypothetical protein